MASDIDLLLSRLDGVKSCGHDKWVALCPAHADKTPSLSIRQLEDSRILINCWSGGCGAIDILNSIDLNFQHLMPDDAISYRGIKGRDKAERMAIAESILEMLPLWQKKGEKFTDAQKAEVREAFLLVNGGGK